MSEPTKLLMPTDAEQMAKRYLIAKGYYHKESVPTREVCAMLMEYTAHIQQMLDRTHQYAMDLLNTQPLPVYITDRSNIPINSLDILSDKKETVSDEES